MKKLLMVAGLAVLAAGCSKASVAGNYSLDKAEMEKAMNEQIAKLPEAERAMAGMATAMLKELDIKLTLAEGGKGTMEMKMGKEGKAENLTWQEKDGKVVINDGKDDIDCALSGSKLTCSNPKKKDEPAMVFVKG